MSVGWVLITCAPFFALAGWGVYCLCVCFFPSWRGPRWRHWKRYSGQPDLTVLGKDIWLTKPAAEGDWPERTARRFYFWAGVAALLIALVGIRHFAGVPVALPDILKGWTS